MLAEATLAKMVDCSWPDSANSTFAESPSSSMGSQPEFCLPSESLIFFDWDDTLFPTTELCDVMGLTGRTLQDKEPFPEVLERMLQDWRVALFKHIEQACSLSQRVVLVTNSRRPWVDQCLDTFAPALKPIFTRVKVVYADEALKKFRKGRSIAGVIGDVKYVSRNRKNLTHEELVEQCTKAKTAAMQHEAKRFYSEMSEHPWKNIISMGDAQYERLACQELAWLSPPAADDDTVRIKTFVVPEKPTITELTLRLKMSTCLMPSCVRFDGDIDCDMDTAANPIQDLAVALELPELESMSFPGHAFGRSKRPELHVENTALAALQLLAEKVEKRSLR